MAFSLKASSDAAAVPRPGVVVRHGRTGRSGNQPRGETSLWQCLMRLLMKPSGPASMGSATSSGPKRCSLAESWLSRPNLPVL